MREKGVEFSGLNDDEDPRAEYPYACPQCDVVCATRTDIISEEDWVTTCWTCDKCDFSWQENFIFDYWDVQN